MLVCGVDVGLKRSYIAVLQGRKLIQCDVYSGVVECDAVGIDAPLSFPKSGQLRDCERQLLEMGIRLFPSGAEFFRPIVERGMQIAEDFRNAGITVFEVYPYATRKILGIAPKAKKFKREGREKILQELSKHVEGVENLSKHDEIDAVISALTVVLYFEGKARVIGENGILIPSV
ncbi:MAG: DUF429 domain-containing protein [Archaeoglobales archaeon]|nr:MAG: DUF429 domain-containing protein [Archaeoglobales archaeon]